MRALILSNGQEPGNELLLKEAAKSDIIICADGAAKWADEKGIKIDCIVGDFDSIHINLAQEIATKHDAQILKLPQIKDMTDTKVCIEIAKEKGADEISLLGALGKRIDHSIANIELLVYCRRIGMHGKIIDEACEIDVSCVDLEFEGKKGDIVSLFPYGVNVKVKKTHNLAYPLENHNLQLGQALGVSNVLTEDYAKVEIANGWLIGIINR